MGGGEAKSSGASKGGRQILVGVDVNAVVEGFASAKRVTAAHRKATRNLSSVLLLGPPPDDKLLALVAHTYTEEEADAVQHLLPFMPLTAAQVARRCGRPAHEVEALLEHMANVKHVVASFGSPKKYTILPLVPGLFEMAIMSPDLARNNSWHKKFAELFEEIFEGGYITKYARVARPPVRYLPVTGNNPLMRAARPADRIEEELEKYDVFGVAHCQCRLVAEMAGNGCGKPTENCVSMGPIAEELIARGLQRRADRKEILEAKLLAEEHGCVTWMMNTAKSAEGNVSCSCCGCCCHALRTVSQFNMPGLFGTPKYVPRMDSAKCTTCGACARACPMGAWEEKGGAMAYDAGRCIGCGLCVKACRMGALELVESRAPNAIDDGIGVLFMKSAPSFALNVFKVWMGRVAGGW